MRFPSPPHPAFAGEAAFAQPIGEATCGHGEGRRPHRHHHRVARFAGPPFGGPGFGGPGFGGPGYGGPRRRRRGDVRLALLRLLAEEPRNGYGLMQAIEERSGGRWRPSPGSVYPTLSQLEDEGLVRVLDRDGGKLYELTDAGTGYLDEREGAESPWGGQEGPGDEARHELRRLTRQVMMAVRQVVHAGDERALERARTTLEDTRRTLYRILADEPEDAQAGEPEDAQAGEVEGTRAGENEGADG